MSHFRNAAGSFQTKFFKRGDIVWVEAPQTLTSASRVDAQSLKRRPFVILEKMLRCKIDGFGRLLEPASFLAVDCTSKDFLVDGRPHVKWKLPKQTIDTHIFADSVREISCACGQEIKLDSSLPKPIQEDLDGKLGAVLQPEKSFFLKRFFSGSVFTPGQIWPVNTRAQSGNGLILLRRGRFFTHDDEDHPQNGATAFAPYLVAMFRSNATVTTMRNVAWADLQVMAVRENAFDRKNGMLGEMTKQTVGIMLNTLRERIMLPPVSYEEPIFSSFHNRIGILGLLGHMR